MTRRFSESDLQGRKESIVAAASEVFLRYGYARTTMGDLADVAKLSRPALYLTFPSKDDIFAAVIESLSEKSLAEFRKSLGKLKTLDSKLHSVCEEWGAHGFELMERHPDARDLFDLAFPPVRQMYEQFIKFLAELLAEPVRASKLKARPEDVARALVYSLRGLKETATDSAHLRRLISLQVDIVLAALQR
jgi:AcrR family transcriptional regulator